MKHLLPKFRFNLYYRFCFEKSIVKIKPQSSAKTPKRTKLLFLIWFFVLNLFFGLDHIFYLVLVTLTLINIVTFFLLKSLIKPSEQ